MTELPAGHLRGYAERASIDISSLSTRDLASELLGRVRHGVPNDLATLFDLLAVLDLETERRHDVFDNRFSGLRARAMFHKGMRHAMSGMLQLEGATVVELGCGAAHPLGSLFVYVVAGASRAVGVDLDPPGDLGLCARGLSRLAGYVLSDPERILGGYQMSREEIVDRLTGFDLRKLWQGDPSGIDWNRMALKTESAEKLSFADDAVDLVYSISVLEHVPDPEAVVKELARITRPGGMSVHTIDGSDHLRYVVPGHHPLAFLADRTDAALVNESNRMRPLAFAALLTRYGFDIVDQEIHERVEAPPDLRRRFVEPFRSLPIDVIEATSVTVHARKKP